MHREVLDVGALADREVGTLVLAGILIVVRFDEIRVRQSSADRIDRLPIVLETVRLTIVAGDPEMDGSLFGSFFSVDSCR